MKNRVFFPQDALDAWMVDGLAELNGAELQLTGKGIIFKVAEAVHVVGEVTGADDAHELVGRVKTRVALEELGAELMESSLLMGDNAYDVVPGWLGLVSPPTLEMEKGKLLASGALAASRGTIEEVLAELLSPSRGPS